MKNIDLDELIIHIKNIFNDTKVKKCEACRYLLFQEKMDEQKYCISILEEIVKEIKEENEYKNNQWTKLFHPFMVLFFIPIYATYISNWCYDNFKIIKDLWIQLGFVAIISIFITFMTIVILKSIFLFIDLKSQKEKQLIRFLQKYCRYLRIKTLKIEVCK